MATKKRMTEAEYKAQYMAEWTSIWEALLYGDKAGIEIMMTMKEEQFDLKRYKRELSLRAKYETPEYKAEERAFLDSIGK